MWNTGIIVSSGDVLFRIHFITIWQGNVYISLQNQNRLYFAINTAMFHDALRWDVGGG
jgi:hypothetical protein